MIHLLILAVHLLATIAKLVRPGGVRAVVAESLLLKHQLLISSRARRRAPNLNSFDRFLLGLGSLFVPPSRIPKLAVILKPRTLFRFHEALKKCKYRWLFSSGGHRRPGPQGPSKELIDAIVEIKRRNPRVGCPRIAQQLAHAFGIDINKDIVRRVLAKHYRPEAGTDGPSWLSFIGHVKDSLWSVDLFRCESILLRSHWVMVVMDVFTRRIIGFGVERADLCGVSVCRMFNQIHRRKVASSAPEFRPRPTISFPSLARQLAHTRGRRDQVDPLRTRVPSVRGTADRHGSTRVSRSRTNLERNRPGAKAGRVQNLLQRKSRSSVAQWQYSKRKIWRTAARPCRP